MQTPSGEKTFTQEELKKLAAEATGGTKAFFTTKNGSAAKYLNTKKREIETEKQKQEWKPLLSG